LTGHNFPFLLREPVASCWCGSLLILVSLIWVSLIIISSLSLSQTPPPHKKMAAAPRQTDYTMEMFRQNARQARETSEAYPIHKEMLKRFIETFESSNVNDRKYGHKKYMRMIQDLANLKTDILTVDTADLLHWCRTQKQRGDAYSEHVDRFMGGVLTNTMRYQEFAYKVLISILEGGVEADHDKSEDVDKVRKFHQAQYFQAMKKQIDDHVEKLRTNPRDPNQIIDDSGNIIEQDNLLAQLGVHDPANPSGDALPKKESSKAIPDRLMYPYEVVFRQNIEDIGEQRMKKPLRELRSSQVGRLVQFDGIVSKVSAVKPKLEVATYKCALCEAQVFQEVDSEEFMPLMDCPTKICKDNKSTGLHEGPQMRLSRFTKYQELKLQELSSEVPVGSIPRSINVVVKGDLTRNCLPGEAVTMTGVYVPHISSGPATGGKLKTTMGVHCHDIQQHKKGYKEDESSYEYQRLLASVKQKAKDPAIYDKLATSIAPQIFGMTVVKKALLLLLVGGCTRGLQDGMKIRGDIHLLLMGDPGVAKSQLLKQVSILAPRSVYTTGKGSSGAGLTAAVTRDPQTNEVHLEGGALVLADSGNFGIWVLLLILLVHFGGFS